MPQTDASRPRLFVRTARSQDARAIVALSEKVYLNEPPYSSAQIRAQINHFPEGVFVAEYDGEVVGFSSSFRISEELALRPHTWDEITGGGYGSRHDPEGEYLYGMEVCVDPDYRRLRIGQRLYNERRKLCRHLRLGGIIFGGRIPGLRRRIKRVGSAEEYVDQVRRKKIRDPVLSFQLRSGFEVLGILPNYLPEDVESLGYAVHLLWHNPAAPEVQPRRRLRGEGPRPQDRIRLAAVQFKQRKLASFEEFAQDVEYFVDVVADYEADFVVFPELFTLQLLSLEPEELNPAQAIEHLTHHTEPFRSFMNDLAVRYNVNIIGGSHPTKLADGEVQNICYVFLRDGSVHEQPKIHPTPNERYWWNIDGGDSLDVIHTDCGPIGVLICYDAEFPELARHLVDQGAVMLFVPFCTDERQSFLRVRYAAQARAVENQCYVVMAGNVGNLPNVANMDIQYAQSCILTPCDFMFARDGIAADTTPNVEMIAVADLRLEDLRLARRAGTVRNLEDRRFDLYSVKWNRRS